MTFDITDILKAVIALAVAIVSTIGIPWLKAKYSAEQINSLLQWVKIGVSAAEQIYSATDGAQKKQYVIQYLAENGITADEDVVNNAIEAAVLELHSSLYGAQKVMK